MDRKTGCVKWFNSRKGYGFITCNNEDIFVHHSALTCSSYRTLFPGENVEFSISPVTNKQNATMASDVTGLSKGRLMCERPV